MRAITHEKSILITQLSQIRPKNPRARCETRQFRRALQGTTMARDNKGFSGDGDHVVNLGHLNSESEKHSSTYWRDLFRFQESLTIKGTVLHEIWPKVLALCLYGCIVC